MWVGGGLLVLPLVLGCGDGPPAAKVPCGPGPCHDTPIGDICPGCAAAPLLPAATPPGPRSGAAPLALGRVDG